MPEGPPRLSTAYYACDFCDFDGPDFPNFLYSNPETAFGREFVFAGPEFGDLCACESKACRIRLNWRIVYLLALHS